MAKKVKLSKLKGLKIIRLKPGTGAGFVADQEAILEFSNLPFMFRKWPIKGITRSS